LVATNKKDERKQMKTYEYIDVEIHNSKAMLPEDFSDKVKNLLETASNTDKRREAYAWIYHTRQAGWTFNAIATPLGVTREWVRIICKNYAESGSSWGVTVDTASIPSVPKAVKQERRVIQVPIPTDDVNELKSLHEQSFFVRGNMSPTHPRRVAAENYLKKILELRERGYTNYRIAKSIGVTIGAVSNRLVRYGYATSNGKSKATTKIKPENRIITSIN
jgi:hypothetical protein